MARRSRLEKCIEMVRLDKRGGCNYFGHRMWLFFCSGLFEHYSVWQDHRNTNQSGDEQVESKNPMYLLHSISQVLKRPITEILEMEWQLIMMQIAQIEIPDKDDKGDKVTTKIYKFGDQPQYKVVKND